MFWCEAPGLFQGSENPQKSENDSGFPVPISPQGGVVPCDFFSGEIRVVQVGAYVYRNSRQMKKNGHNFFTLK